MTSDVATLANATVLPSSSNTCSTGLMLARGGPRRTPTRTGRPSTPATWLSIPSWSGSTFSRGSGT